MCLSQNNYPLCQYLSEHIQSHLYIYITTRINDQYHTFYEYAQYSHEILVYINCTVILIDISTRIFMKSSCSREQDYIDSTKFKMTYEALA